MILTVTANPSVDLTYMIEDMQVGAFNWTKDLSKTAGGKGLNVARVCTDFGLTPTVTGFLGGYTGDYIANKLSESDISQSFVPIQDDNRHCVAVVDQGVITRFREHGPSLTEADEKRFLVHFEGLIDYFSTLVIAGSCPKGLSKDFYYKLLTRAKDRGVFTGLATKGRFLKQTLVYETKPDVLVLTREEAEEFLGRPITQECLSKLFDRANFKNIPMIFITIAGLHVLVKMGDKGYLVSASGVEIVNPLGAEDALMAGICYAREKGFDSDQLMRIAATAYFINCMEPVSAHINLLAFQSVLRRLTVIDLKAAEGLPEIPCLK